MPTLLSVVAPSGRKRDGLPVLVPDPGPDPAAADVLLKGFSGRLLRLYAMVQERLHREGGPPPEPAYLLFSGEEGGFARKGFYLGDRDKRHAGYVDLRAGSPLTGRFGAVDQIFPHELGHVIHGQLAGEPPPGGCNQVHAISLRSDPVVAFAEGFAEHLQVMAVDDPDAEPDTKALAADSAAEERMNDHLDRYLAEVQAEPGPKGGLVNGFLRWFPGVEQAERYFAVKGNRFAFEPSLPERLLGTDDPYRAYLIEGVVPGRPGDAPKSPARAFSTEGFVSTFFVRLVCSPEVRERPADDGLYAAFGVTAADVGPLENAYLKVLHAIRTGQTHTLLQFLASYRRAFPDEEGLLADILGELLSGQDARPAAPMWLACDRFSTGTSLFDQYRCAPRAHTFDLNAASAVDLVAVPGVNLELARSLLCRAPFADLQALAEVEGMTRATVERFRRMESRMAEVRSRPDEIVKDLFRAFGLILKSYGLE